MRTPRLGPCPSHSQRNWAVLIRLRCEQTIVAQPRVTPAGGVPRRGSQVQKKKKSVVGIEIDHGVTLEGPVLRASPGSVEGVSLISFFLL